MTTISAQVLALIKRFDRNSEEYHGPQYNEAQLRAEFINPLFKALSWDVENEQGFSERYKEVIHEDSIKVAGATKAPDYSFRVGGLRKFFVEAKKPAVGIKDDPLPAFQLRRYAWSSKLPLSILTNFREFAVYDCRFKPKPSDAASAGRIEYFTFKQYADKWAWLVEIFSKDSVLRGYYDRFSESTRTKRGTEEVDSAFLGEIERWRDALARNLALRNQSLSSGELNFGVQRIIDRIIFLRICEDRGIEPYGQLLSLTNGHELYHRLCDLFRKADYKYNSGLFHFEREKGRSESPDEITLSLSLDDKVLVDIIGGLYYPDSPYEFSVFPADILGQVYEQFLGKVIRLTPSHLAKVEYKPEVKKAGGVYYTPTYVVDYIVAETVGRLLEGRTPRTARKLRILDPTCGSGSFLLGAFEFLLNWHRLWYANNAPQSHGKEVYRGPGGDWRLTVEERKRILRDNIFGVDIDPQAVEVTKLSLLLKVLENETEESISRQQRLFHRERVLPDLGENIKCGNSLIGQDYFAARQGGLFEQLDESLYAVNAFDWHREFPGVLSQGGFHAVIGNPPWGASFTEDELEYLRVRYASVVDRMVDSYIYFLYLATRVAGAKGYVGFIVPGTFLSQVDAQSIRRVLLARGLSCVVNLGQGIFGSKVLNTSSIVVSKQRSAGEGDLVLADLSSTLLLDRRSALGPRLPTVSFTRWKKAVDADPHGTFFAGPLVATSLLLRLRKKYPPLRGFLDGDIQRGVTPDVVAAHALSLREAKSLKVESDVVRLSVSGCQIKRYHKWNADQAILYTHRDTEISKYPNALAHLAKFRSANSCPEVRDGKHPWWALHRPREPRIFQSPKFIGLTTTKTIELIYDHDKSLFVTDAMYVFRVSSGIDPWALMAILQSRPFLFLYRVANQGEARVIPQVKASKLHELPVPLLGAEPRYVSSLTRACKRMLVLHEALATERLAVKREAVLRQIERLDSDIDGLVCGLYGLNEAELSIIERSVGE